MAKQTPEGRVKDAMRKAFKEFHPEAFVFLPASGVMGSNGIPDFVCCVPLEITQDMVGETVGIFAGVEAKTTAGKLSDLQRDKLNKISDASGVACLVWGSDDARPKISNMLNTIHQPFDESKP
jgi:hypothetical protein